MSVGLTVSEKSHLLRRTCFSAPDSLIQATASIDNKGDLVDWLLAQPLAEYNYPDWYLSPPDLSGLEKDARKQLRRDIAKSLQVWWQQLFFTSNSPFYEQITLFWHNHFVSSLKKVKLPNAMLAQNDLFRQQGLGNFKSLLASVLKDPAMLLYLDNATSKKQSPNENLARELLELFTLGEGNYSEFDIKEIARALTGASVKKRTGEYVFRSRWHDDDEKTIFGETGHFSVDDLAKLIVKQPACAEFIVTKFWLHFVDETPIADEIERIAQIFTEADFEIVPMLKALLMSDAFWQSQGKQVKSPVQLIVGTFRQFELNNLATSILTTNKWIGLTKNMGQHLFMPPNVKGWSGGRSWYASAAIFYREKFVYKFSHWQRNASLSSNEEQLFAVEPVAGITKITNATELALALADPAYQVQ